MPEKCHTNCLVCRICIITLFALLQIWHVGLKYMTPSQVKRTYFHLNKEWRISLGCSEHLVVQFYPRIQFLLRLSRYIAIFNGQVANMQEIVRHSEKQTTLQYLHFEAYIESFPIYQIQTLALESFDELFLIPFHIIIFCM